MTYEGKQLPPEIIEAIEPEAEKPASDHPSIGKRIAAGTIAGVFTLSVLPHGVECADPDVLGSLLCQSKTLVREDSHIEMGGNTSSSGAGVQIVAIGTAARALTLSDSSGWVVWPKSN